MFRNGTILWRSVHHNARTGVVVPTINFDKTEKGTYIARVQIEGCSDFLWEPSIVSNSFQDERGKVHVFGLVLFIEQLPPDDWTHMLVSGTSKAMREPLKPGADRKGHAVFAKVAKPYPMAEYRRFREQVYRVVHENLNANFEQKKNLMLGYWPNEIRPTEHRLLAHQHHSLTEDPVLFDYCHLRQLPPDVVQTGIVTMKAP
jgi:hypothetical protein